MSGSVFVVVFYDEDPSFSILQLGVDDDLKEPVVSLDVAKTRWSVSPPISRTNGDGNLYLLPERCAADKPFHGYKFNFTTGSLQNICLPPSIKKEKDGKILSVVNLRGCIYRLANHYLRWPGVLLVESVFDCYDPLNKSWKALKPFPPFLHEYDVLATAVLDDTILFNVFPGGLWAYDVCRNEWYIVESDDPRCFGIEGDTVVVENTIYALSGPRSKVVLALSLEKKESGGDLVFQFSVLSEIPIPSLKSMLPGDDEIGQLFPSLHVPWVRTTHLVHLGKVDFCLVRNCSPLSSLDHKPINVTYMRLTGQTKMTVLSNRWLKTRYESLSEVVLCFSLPKRKTTALEQGKRFVFELDPFTPECHTLSICVRDLPPDITDTQLEMGLMKFGPIKRDGIQVRKNKKGKYFAFVEFESLISKQLAIKASTLTLRGCPVRISKKT